MGGCILQHPPHPTRNTGAALSAPRILNATTPGAPGGETSCSPSPDGPDPLAGRATEIAWLAVGLVCRASTSSRRLPEFVGECGPASLLIKSRLPRFPGSVFVENRGQGLWLSIFSAQLPLSLSLCREREPSLSPCIDNTSRAQRARCGTAKRAPSPSSSSLSASSSLLPTPWSASHDSERGRA